MKFRISIAVAYLLFVANMGDVFGLTRFNIVEKGAFLVASVMCLVTRPFSKAVLSVFAACLLMIVVLGATTDFPEFSWGVLLLSLNQIVIIYALLAVRPSRKDCDWLLTLVAACPGLSVLFGLVYQGLGIWSVYSGEYGTGIARLQGSLIPAFLSGLAMCGTFAALQRAASGKRTSFYGVASLNAAILLLAGGRAALGVTVLVCSIYFYSTPTVRPRVKVYGTIAALLALPLLLLVFGGTAFDRLTQSSDNGRDVMWAYLFLLAKRYPWTGIGFGHQFWTTPHEIQVQVGSNAAHNDYIRLLVELGIVGVIMFYLQLTVAVVIAWRHARFGLSIVTAYLGFLFMSLTDNALATPAYFPLLIVAVFGSIRYHAERTSRTQQRRRNNDLAE